MSDAEQTMIVTEWETDRGTYPVYSKEDAGSLRRAAINRACVRPLPLIRLGMLAVEGELYGQDAWALLCRPVTRNKRRFRQFAQGVTQNNLRQQGKVPILCAEALGIRPQSSPPGSWVLRLVHRACHDQHPFHFSEMDELLMRVDAVPLETFVQHSAGPIKQRQDEVADEARSILTRLDEVVDMIEHVDYGALHSGHRMEPDPLQPGGKTLRQVRDPPARFHRLYARGRLHKTRDLNDALIQAYKATGQG